MYVDSKKFPYENSSDPETQRRIERDKEFAKNAYKKWMDDNVNDIVERLWEIDDIGVVEKSGEFIELIKEAEFTYSAGAYVSSIALVGVAAEDMLRFYAKMTGNNLDKLQQFERINEMEKLGLIQKSVANDFQNIRKIRNDCLHFGDKFKRKSNDVLKYDAISSINSMKAVYKNLMHAEGSENKNAELFEKIMEHLCNEAVKGAKGSVINLDDIVIRMRNIFYDILGFDLSSNSGGKEIRRFGIYEVMEVDLEFITPEISLGDLSNGFLFIVDVGKDEIEYIRNLNLNVGDQLLCQLISIQNGLEMTAEWRFEKRPLVAKRK